MRTETADPLDNQLLSSLGATAIQRVTPPVEMLQVRARQTLTEGGVHPEYVYFPTTAVVSVVRESGAGKNVEVASIGKEGMVGVSLFLGRASLSGRAQVVMSGGVARMAVEAFRAAVTMNEPFNVAVRAYAARMLAELETMLLCTRLHSTSQQLAAWLLRNANRAGRNDFELTHEHIAALFGVRRATISEVIHHWKRAHILGPHRRRLIILDRERLMEHSCECYDSTHVF